MTSGRKAPALSDTSTVKDIAAYVAYYEGRGYTVTTNRQAFNPDGTVESFHFAATRHEGADQGSASASIEAASRTVSTSESSSSTTTTTKS